MLRSLVAAGLLALTTPVLAAAQEARPEIREGARIRVSAPIFRKGQRVAGTSQWIVGTVRGITPTSVILQTDPADSTSRTDIPYSVIRNLDVSRGHMDSRTSVRRGAARGALVGAGTAAVFYGTLFAISGGDNDCAGECAEPTTFQSLFDLSGGYLARNVGVLVGTGTLVGALVGTRAREKWDSARVPRVRVSPSTSSTTLSLSIHF